MSDIRKITIEVSCCESCPQYEDSPITFEGWCNELDKVVITQDFIIQPDCPLPSPPEVQSE